MSIFAVHIHRTSVWLMMVGDRGIVISRASEICRRKRKNAVGGCSKGVCWVRTSARSAVGVCLLGASPFFDFSVDVFIVTTDSSVLPQKEFKVETPTADRVLK